MTEAQQESKPRGSVHFLPSAGRDIKMCRSLGFTQGWLNRSLQRKLVSLKRTGAQRMPLMASISGIHHSGLNYQRTPPSYNTQPAPSCLEVQPVHTHLSRAAPAGPTTSMTQHLPGSAPTRPSTLYDLAPLGSTSLQTSTYQDSALEGPSIFREYQTIICQ